MALIKLKEEVLRLRKEERRRKGEAEVLELLSMEDLVCLEREVESSLSSIRERQDQLRAGQKEESLRKEAELLRENEKLRKEVAELQRARWEGCGLPVESRATSACSSVSTSRDEVAMPMSSDDHSDTFLQLRLMLNNLMKAHGLQLLNYEPPTQDPTFQEALNERNTREEREDHSQDDAFSGRSRSPSRRTRRPLEREDNSLRNRVQESGIKRRRSPFREVSSSPSPRGRKREQERHARRRHKSKRTPSPSSSLSKRSSFSSSSH
ncbi:hypothetical protein L7F22_001684 [Adiantum nelumboides]|nr:hypothetical protein [Adiantum nelumboides]